MSNNNPLSASEQQSIAKAILTLINTEYPNLPVSRVEYQSLDINNSSMSIYNLSNSVIDRQYINGSYIATYKFSLVYRSIPTNTLQRVDCEELLSNIANWLVSVDLDSYISLTGNRYVDNISITSPPVLFRQYQNGSEDYHVIFALKYKKEV